MADGIQPGDLVQVARLGRTFYARVVGHERFGRYVIAPLDPDVRVRSARLAEMTGHWADRGDPRPRRDTAQASFDHLLDR